MTVLARGSMYMDGMMAVIQMRDYTHIPTVSSVILRVFTKAFILLRLPKTAILRMSGR